MGLHLMRVRLVIVSTHMTDILPSDKRLKFFVYVIESPSAVDLYHRRSEGDMLRQAINLNQIACALRLAVNLEAFTAAIRIGLYEAMADGVGDVARRTA